MSDFLPEIEVTQSAAEAMARGLYTVAHVDGLHEREEALVASFWAEVGGGAASLSELQRAATITPPELKAALPTPALGQMFVKTAILLAWADGKVSDGERKIIGELAAALGITGADFTTLEAAVKEYLLGHLAPIQNSAAVATVAKKLGV
jgi:tellurite resistance protein